MYVIHMKHGMKRYPQPPQETLPMQKLSEILTEPITLTTPHETLVLLRRVIVAIAGELKPETSSYKTTRKTLYRTNELLADWESQEAFGRSDSFRNPYPEDKTKK